MCLVEADQRYGSDRVGLYTIRQPGQSLTTRKYRCSTRLKLGGDAISLPTGAEIDEVARNITLQIQDILNRFHELHKNQWPLLTAPITT